MQKNNVEGFGYTSSCCCDFAQNSGNAAVVMWALELLSSLLSMQAAWWLPIKVESQSQQV